MKKYIMIYVTVPNKSLALKIGKSCVKDRLAACANVVESAVSIYEWQGKICQEQECILLMKTVHKNSSKVIKKVQGLHEYACPCILVLPIVGGNEDFLNWISKECMHNHA